MHLARMDTNWETGEEVKENEVSKLLLYINKQGQMYSLQLGLYAKNSKSFQWAFF